MADSWVLPDDLNLNAFSDGSYGGEDALGKEEPFGTVSYAKTLPELNQQYPAFSMYSAMGTQPIQQVDQTMMIASPSSAMAPLPTRQMQQQGPAFPSQSQNMSISTHWECRSTHRSASQQQDFSNPQVNFQQHQQLQQERQRLQQLQQQQQLMQPAPANFQTCIGHQHQQRQQQPAPAPFQTHIRQQQWQQPPAPEPVFVSQGTGAINNGDGRHPPAFQVTGGQAFYHPSTNGNLGHRPHIHQQPSASSHSVTQQEQALVLRHPIENLPARLVPTPAGPLAHGSGQSWTVPANHLVQPLHQTPASFFQHQHPANRSITTTTPCTQQGSPPNSYFTLPQQQAASPFPTPPKIPSLYKNVSTTTSTTTTPPPSETSPAIESAATSSSETTIPLTSNIPPPDQSAAKAKKSPGRPRKDKTTTPPTSNITPPTESAAKPKKPPGRPRKDKSTAPPASNIPPPKKSLGRPRKDAGKTGFVNETVDPKKHVNTVHGRNYLQRAERLEMWYNQPPATANNNTAEEKRSGEKGKEKIDEDDDKENKEDEEENAIVINHDVHWLHK